MKKLCLITSPDVALWPDDYNLIFLSEFCINDINRKEAAKRTYSILDVFDKDILTKKRDKEYLSSFYERILFSLSTFTEKFEM